MRFIPVIVLALSACGGESSPEGRMKIRTEMLQADIDSLKVQNKVILDSLTSIRDELKLLRKETK